MPCAAFPQLPRAGHCPPDEGLLKEPFCPIASIMQIVLTFLAEGLVGGGSLQRESSHSPPLPPDPKAAFVGSPIEQPGVGLAMVSFPGLGARSRDRSLMGIMRDQHRGSHALPADAAS